MSATFELLFFTRCQESLPDSNRGRKGFLPPLTVAGKLAFGRFLESTICHKRQGGTPKLALGVLFYLLCTCPN